MSNPNDLNYSDLTDTPPNPLPSPPPNPGRPSGGMPGEENIAANNDRPLPGPIKGDAPWQIELRYLPIGPRGLCLSIRREIFAKNCTALRIAGTRAMNRSWARTATD